MKKGLTIILCLALALSLVLGGCASAPSESSQGSTPDPSSGASGSSQAEPAKLDKIRVAMIAPMTGDSAQYGQQFERGAELMIEDFEKETGIPVELDIFDDKNDPKETVNLGNQVISDGGYAFVLGPFASGNALALAELLDEEKIPVISPSVSHEDFIADYDYTFRVGQLNYYEGVFVAKYCAQKWDTKKIAGIYSQNDWGLTLDAEFVKEAEAQGLEVVANEAYLVGQTKDFSSILTKISQSGADTLYLMAQYAETGQILRQMYDMGIDMKVCCSSSAYKAETLELAGADAVENMDLKWFNTFTLDNPEPVVQDFRTRVREVYDVEIDNFITRSYDSMKVMLEAIARAGSTDPDAIKAEVMNVRDFNSVSGPFTIQDDRNVTRQFYVCVPKGTEGFEFLESPKLS